VVDVLAVAAVLILYLSVLLSLGQPDVAVVAPVDEV
jgi:hypothetical protein